MNIGSAAVDYINTIEPSGSNAISNSSKENDFANIDEVITIDSIPSVAKKRKTSVVYNKSQNESWKEKYFQNMVEIDEKYNEANIRKADLKSYNLLLRSMSLEKTLQLKEHEIIGLRSSISPNLVLLPTHFSEFTVVEENQRDELNQN